MDEIPRDARYFPEGEGPYDAKKSLKDPINRALEVASRLGQQIIDESKFDEPYDPERLERIARVDYAKPFEEVRGELREVLGFPKELRTPAELLAKERLPKEAHEPVAEYLAFIARHADNTIETICKAVHSSGRENTRGLLERLAGSSKALGKLYKSFDAYEKKGEKILEGAGEGINSLKKYPTTDDYPDFMAAQSKDIEGLGAAQEKLRKELTARLQPDIPSPI